MTFSPTERERRLAALHELIEHEGVDVLVLVANDYRGHKGVLRWIADYNLAHRYGFAIVPRGGQPELVLPENLALARRGGWETPIRHVRRMGPGLAEALSELEPLRVGVVGLGEVMRVADYVALREGLLGVELVDVSLAFERVRARKSAEEQQGAREATRIAERCFERLLEVTRPGVTERAVGAEMYGTAARLGGEDFLFLTMYARGDGNGSVRPEFGVPGERVLSEGEQFIFSFELVGPLGYWMEFSRMVAIGEPTEVMRRMNSAVRAGMEAAAAAMRPAARPDRVQQVILNAVDGHGARSSYWSGHGLGTDVIEEPWIGLEVVQDRDVPPSGWTLEEGMVLSVHPFVVDRSWQGIGYMADTYVIGADGGEALSSVPLDLHVVR